MVLRVKRNGNFTDETEWQSAGSESFIGYGRTDESVGELKKAWMEEDFLTGATGTYDYEGG